MYLPLYIICEVNEFCVHCETCSMYMYLYVIKIYWVSSVSETEGFYRKSCIGVNELISLHHFVNRIVHHIFSFGSFCSRSLLDRVPLQ